MNKLFIKTLTICYIIFVLLTSPLYADEIPVYMYNGRLSVREDVFNEMVIKYKLANIYKEENDKLNQYIIQLKKLNEEQSKIYENRIETLDNIIEEKDLIINTQTDTINKYKEIENKLNCNEYKTKIKHMKRLNIIEKVVILGISGYAISEIDDTNAKIAVGSLATAVCLINW